MERKIGETFEFEGKKLQVKESEEGSCNFCFFNAECKNRNLHVSGACDGAWRDDGKNVIFVEVQEQPQETEEGKERKVGEVFEYEGKKLKVVETEKDSYNNCYLEDCECAEKGKVCGACLSETRTDNKPVIFVEVKEEPEEQPQPQKINLCEVLKDCPKGEMFWSPVFGDVWFYDIDQYTKRVKVRTSGVGSWYINADGTITIDKVTSPEIMLYPSLKQRDWSKFTAPWLKKERFDPKTLKPFDSVLVYGEYEGWFCTIFSHITVGSFPNNTASGNYAWCIPYNDETKHLVGTKYEAPYFYKYWED